jgi:ADP-heptose:LPS heptosyltransferase
MLFGPAQHLFLSPEVEPALPKKDESESVVRSAPGPGSPKLLVIEFWGIGDLTFSTPLLHAATAQGWAITLAGKPHARPLLAPTFPALRFIEYDAPWSAYREKYKVWRWNGPELIALIRRLRRERFDAAVSVRNDPRDHLLMWLIGARRRYGFPHRGSGLLLTDALVRPRPKQHKVEDWHTIALALGLPLDGASPPPRLDHPRYRSAKVDALFSGIRKPVVCVHTGARIPVRRWPVEYFAEVVRGLRRRYSFHLLLIPDLDGYGRELEPLSDAVAPPLAVNELVDVVGRADLLICNDSGPGHIAAACGRPAMPFFGPTDPDWFRPWGHIHHLVIRDICPWRPCFDYCKFREPHCLTKLLPVHVMPEIEEYVEGAIGRGILPGTLKE